MAWVPSADATERALGRLMCAEPDGEAFRQEAIRSLRRAVGFDGWCWARLDARNRLPAHGSLANETGSAAIFARMFRGRYAVRVEPDDPIGTLSAETSGRLAGSIRWRELLGPLGHHDELRAVLTVNRLCWGHLILYRDLRGSPFTEQHVRLMRRVAPLLGMHMRASFRQPRSQPGIEVEPGTLLFDAALNPVAATPAAANWLEALGCPAALGLPAFVYALAARAADSGSGVAIRARALDGRWARLYAAPLTPAGGAASVAVVIGPPTPVEVADLVMRAWCLSRRERQVAAGVILGQNTREIATARRISEHTVRQHIKTIFTKVDVHGRDQLRGVLTDDPG